MFNPFPLFDVKYLGGFKQKGVKCFVKQTYDRGRNLLEDNPRPSFLISHYTDKGLALEHMDALKHDSKACILMIDNEDDLKELQRMGSKHSDSLVYMYFKQADGEIRAKKVLDKKLHAYIDYKLGWKVAGGTTVEMKLDFIFGDIYVELRYGSKFKKVKIEEIEKTEGYVL